MPDTNLPTAGTANVTAVTNVAAPFFTEYVILKQAAANDYYTYAHHGDISARSAADAIRRFLEGDTEPAGTYVAVPVRSWKPVTVRAEQTTVLRLEDAK